MLSSLGISGITLKAGTKWASAYEHEGEAYDLEYHDGRLILVRSKPKITRDEYGRVVSVEVRSLEEAKAHRRRIPKGATMEFKEVDRPVPFDARDFRLSFGPDFGRLIMKMCAALSTLMPSFSPDDIRETVSILKSDEPRVEEARKDFRPFPIVEKAMPLLSHAIYVERGATGLHGFVVLFGHIRMYCKIASSTASKEPCAILGILDISNGHEHFSEIDPPGLTEAPFVMSTQIHDRGIEEWTAELQRQVSAAGAKGWLCTGHVPQRPVSSLWRSSTSDISFDSWTGSTLALTVPRPQPKKN